MSFLKEKELIDIVKYSRTTLQKWRKEGMPFMRPQRTIRYDFDDVKKWMYKHKGVETNGKI